MKRFWSFIKQSKKDYTGVPTLKRNGISYTSSTGKANILNEQFESVFTNEVPITDRLLPENSPYTKMKDTTITEAGVQKLIRNLKIHKAMGPDNIGPQVLR